MCFFVDKIVFGKKNFGENIVICEDMVLVKTWFVEIMFFLWKPVFFGEKWFLAKKKFCWKNVFGENMIFGKNF